jgi:hypothetical protein
VWPVLSKRQPDRAADLQAVARRLMKWASVIRTASSMGLSRPAFVWLELDRLGLGQNIDGLYYSGQLYLRHVKTLGIRTEVARST